jgi:hypothetical protein
MKRKLTKEKLAILVNKRFPRIANYLKKLNNTKTIKENNYNIAMTIALHKVYLSTITTQEIIDYIINYLMNNYINEYIKLVEEDITIDQIKTLLLEMPSDEKELIDKNVLKVYKAIEKAYKTVEIVE